MPTLYKDGKQCNCTIHQVASMEKGGWTRTEGAKAEKKKAAEKVEKPSLKKPAKGKTIGELDGS